MTVCLPGLIIILFIARVPIQNIEELLSQPSTSAAVTVQECEDLPSSNHNY